MPNSSLLNNNTGLSLQNGPPLPWYNLAFTIICVFGVFTNAINIAVFRSPQLADKVYTCLLFCSISDFIYVTLSIFANLLICGPSCPRLTYTLIGSIYSLYFVSFGCATLNLFSVSIEIFLSLQRYFLLINKPLLMNVPLPIIISFLLFLSAFANVPTLANYQIVTNNNSAQGFSFVLNGFGATDVGKTLKTLSSWANILLTSVVLTLLNIVTAFKFRAYFTNKAQLTQTIPSRISVHRSSKSLFFQVMLFNRVDSMS